MDRDPQALLLRRPLLPLVIGFILGILLDSALPVPLAILAPTTAAFLLLAGFAAWRRAIWLGASALLFACLAIGAARSGVATRTQAPHDVARIADDALAGPLRLEGIIAQPPQRLPWDAAGAEEPHRLRLLLDVLAIGAGAEERPATGRVRLTILREEGSWQYGQRIRGEFHLRRPRGYRNPGGFDYPRYLATQGVGLEGWASDDAAIAAIPGFYGHPMAAGIFDVRAALLRRIDQAYPAPEAGLLKAAILGDRSGLDRAVDQAFLDSGTYHVLAISGLNVSVLAASLFLLLRLVRAPARLAALLSIGVVTAYAALAGGSPSVVRAAIMADVYLLAVVLDREADLLNTLALSALVVLLANPLFLGDVGFQLTFLATLAIVLAVEGWAPAMARWPRPARWMGESLLITLAATLGTLPVLAATFNRFSPIGLLANLVVVPLSGIITAAGTAASALLLVLSDGFGPLNWATGVLVRAMVWAAQLFAGVPFASVRLYTPTPAMVATYLVAVAALLCRWPERWWWRVAGAAGFVLALQVALRLWPVLDPPALRVTVLDVGQGDAILVEAPGRRAILVDGGGLFDEGFDLGERVVAPYLLHRWIGRLEAVVLTHPHPDHANGLAAILKGFPVGEAWDSGVASGMPRYLWIAETLRERRIPHKVPEAGFRWGGLAPVEVEVLHPRRPFLSGSRRGRYSDVNSNSLVLRVRYGDVAILLTGDIEEEAEAQILSSVADVRAAVMKVPHHGGRTSSSRAFLGRVAPRYAVVSVGDRNRFRHPHPEALERYRDLGIRVYRTDRHGAVTAVTDGKGVWLEPLDRGEG